MIRATTGSAVTARFDDPSAHLQALEKLGRARLELRAGRAELEAHRTIMMAARYTPEAYAQAEADLEALTAKVSKLATEVKQLQKQLTVV